MATKKISVAAQLKAIKVEHAAQTQEVVKLRKELEQANGYKKWADDAKVKAQAELEQVHCFFDAMGEQTVARKTPAEYGQNDNSAMTRLSVFLANRK